MYTVFNFTVRSSSLDTTSDKKTTGLPPTTSRTPTHTAFTKIIHSQTNPELDEYVDMSNLKSKKKPEGQADIITAEYVDMSSMKKKNNNTLSTDIMNSLMLSNYYADQSTSSKGPTTVGLSSAVAVPSASSHSVPTPLDISPRNEYRVPTSSTGSSRHDSFDVLEPSNPPPMGPPPNPPPMEPPNPPPPMGPPPNPPPPMGPPPNPPPMEPPNPPPPMGPPPNHPPIEPPNPPPMGSELYCNLEELQAQVFKLSSDQTFDAVDYVTAEINTSAVLPEPLYVDTNIFMMPPEATYSNTSTPAVPSEAITPAVLPEAIAPAVPPEAIYSNLSALNLPLIRQSLPPRDIQRMLQASVSLPAAPTTTPLERSNSMNSGEEVPLTSSQNSSDIASPKEQESSAFSSTRANRPVIARKPVLKPKPGKL